MSTVAENQKALDEMSLDELIDRHVAGDIETAERGYRALIAAGDAGELVYSNLAVICLKSGRRSEAIELLTSAVEINDDSHEAHLNLGVALAEEGNLDEAERHYRRCIGILPTFQSARINLGLLLQSQQRLEEALSVFQETVALAADSAEAHFNLGNVYMALGRYDEAIASFRRSLEISGDQAGTYLNLGVVLGIRSSEDPAFLEEAIDAYRKAIQAAPHFPDPYNNLGNALKTKGAFEEAVVCYKKAAELRPSFFHVHANLGDVLRILGRKEEAVEAFKQAIEHDGEFLEAHLALATTLQDLGRHEESCSVYDAVLGFAPDNMEALYQRALVRQKLNRLEDAVEAYSRLTAVYPDHAQGINDLGVCKQMLGRSDEALECFQRAVELNPNSHQALLNLGVLAGAESLDRAIEYYHKSLSVCPEYPEALNNLGVAYKEKKLFDESIAALEKAIAIRPDYAEAYYNLGYTYQSKDLEREAIYCYRKAIEIKPSYAQAYINLGVASTNLRYFEDEKKQLEYSLECYWKALEIVPEYAEAYNNLGVSLQDLDRFDEAIDCYRKSLAIKADCSNTLNNLGNALREHGRLDEAIDSYQESFALKCEAIEDNRFIKELGRLFIELERIPIVYSSQDEVPRYREQYMAALEGAWRLICEEGRNLTEEETALLRRIMFRVTNFYLAYQQHNDVEPYKLYCKVAAFILKIDLEPYLKLEEPRRPIYENGVRRKIRLGIASEFLKYHNGSFWAYSWLSNLPRDDYEFFLYSLNGNTDDVTRMWSELGTYRWLPFREGNYQASMKLLREDELDIFILPDVGMGGPSRILSLTRMAPIQCVAWGHPMTSGSETIDYYLSSDLMESDEADEHYSEELIRLPNLGLYLEQPLTPTNPTRAQFDLPEDRPILGSVQSLFKYLPKYDHVFTDIAKRLPDALLVFCGYKSEKVTEQFAARIRRAFDEAGLDFDRQVRIMPRMSLPDFTQLLGVLDVNLDSIGWSGGITTMRSFCAHLPLVTTAGEFMRGRHSSAMLEMIGLDELIAGSLDEYVELAVKLCEDADYRRHIAEQLQEKKHLMLCDLEPVRELDRFFKKETERRLS